MKHIAIIAVGIICLGALGATGTEVTKPNAFRASLGAVSAPELPAQAAVLVKQARTAERGTVTIDVVKAAMEINATAAPLVVGSIAHSVSEMAAVAAASAAQEQPKQAVAVAKAAAVAAPSKAGKIVVSVCRVAPDQYRAIALAVSEVCPGASREILKSVAASFPNGSQLKGAIEKALADYSGNTVSVASVLDQAIAMASANGDARGPSTGPPSVTMPPTSTALPPGSFGIVPTGGRTYAAP